MNPHVALSKTLGSTLLCTTSDDKFLRVFGIMIMTKKIAINKTKRKISQILQNKMCFPLLHYTSKNETKGHECCYKKKKKEHSKLPIERK